jgi:hypothetical protein
VQNHWAPFLASPRQLKPLLLLLTPAPLTLRHRLTGGAGREPCTPRRPQVESSKPTALVQRTPPGNEFTRGPRVTNCLGATQSTLMC